MSLISSRGSAFTVAFSAVNWPGSVWFEGNFTFLSTVGTGCLMEFLAITHFLIQLLYCLLRAKNVLHRTIVVQLGFKPISSQTQPFTFKPSEKHTQFSGARFLEVKPAT